MNDETEMAVENSADPQQAAADLIQREVEVEETGHEARAASDLVQVFDVPVHISAVLGRTNMEVNELLKLRDGDILELDRKVGEAIDIYVNNRLVARGEVVIVEDKLGVTMTEIIKTDRN